jgi:putative transposase
VTAVYAFIAQEKADPTSPWSVAEMCRVLGVSRSGFYDWHARTPSQRDVTDRLLAAEIELGVLRAYLWGAAGARLAASAGLPGGPQAGRADHARTRLGRPDRPGASAYHPPRHHARACA